MRIFYNAFRHACQIGLDGKTLKYGRTSSFFETGKYLANFIDFLVIFLIISCVISVLEGVIVRGNY